MTQETPRFERFLESAARAVSGSGIHPIAVLQQVQAAGETGVRDGAMPNRYRIRVSQNDAVGITRLEGSLRSGIERMLDEMMQQRHLSRLGEWDIAFEPTPELSAGEVRVSAVFAEEAHRELATERALARPTEVITRLRGTVLVLPDGARIRVTHAPFVIGRAQGCDLVIPDLSISRRHAVIHAGPGRPPVLRNLESRNGIAVRGEQVVELELDPGSVFELGDVSFTVEEEER